jgi:hypothetical protein
VSKEPIPSVIRTGKCVMSFGRDRSSYRQTLLFCLAFHRSGDSLLDFQLIRVLSDVRAKRNVASPVAITEMRKGFCSHD